MSLFNAKTLTQIKTLIKVGADIDERDDSGNTFLIHMCYQNKFSIVKILVDAGADVNIKGNFGRTAIMYACIRGNYEAVKFLTYNGANLNLKSESGDTAFMYAFEGNYVSYGILEFLVQNGADVNIKNDKGNTVLLLFAYKSRNHPTQIAKSLINYGANINAVNNYGQNALMCSILSKHGNDALEKYLVYNGIQINHKDLLGNTALMYACYYKKMKTIKLLVDAGANQNIVNNEGKNALYFSTNTIGIGEWL